jgi:RsiW-degrading membrane proteinase PrsW (M82 family)
MFYMVLNITKDKKVSSHPSRFMFYFAMVGLGFAIIENVQYVQIIGLDLPQ